MDNSGIKSVNLIIFLWYLIYYGSFHKVVKVLGNKYKTYNFKIIFFCRTLWILQDKKNVKKVLSKGAGTQLTFANKAFFSAHGHNYGIGNMDYQDGECLWKGVHNSLLKANDTKILVEIMEKHRGILFGKYGFEYCINDVLEEYIMTVWAEYCFGSNVDFKEYFAMRDIMLDTLRKTFYSSSTNLVPYIGSLMCRLRRWWHKDKFQKVDTVLKKFISNDEGFIYRFKQKFVMYNYEHNIVSSSEINKIVLDNAFLSVLVYDFVYMVLLDTLVTMAKDNINDLKERKAINPQSLDRAFLFPFRFRYFNKGYDMFGNGDYAIINMLCTKLHFSYGPRACIGPKIFNIFYKQILEMLKDYRITCVDNNKVSYDTDPNIPAMISKHTIRLKMDKEYLKENMPHYEHKGITKFYRVTWINERPELMNYIYWKMEKYVKNRNYDCDGIVTAEARGFLYAPEIANKLNLPLYPIRKAGKLPGPTYSETYSKAYDKEETVEISKDCDLIGKNLVLIDDGIATGGTTRAIYDLINKAGGNVISVIVILKHTYTKCEFNECDVYNIFEL